MKTTVFLKKRPLMGLNDRSSGLTNRLPQFCYRLPQKGCVRAKDDL